MYGCANPCLVYGFNLGNRSYTFETHWLEENYPGIECYAADIVKNYLGEPIYGVACYFDNVNGQAIIPSEEEKETVKNLYNKYIEYINKNKISVINYAILGYHLAVYGWDGEQHDIISLD